MGTVQRGVVIGVLVVGLGLYMHSALASTVEGDAVSLVSPKSALPEPDVPSVAVLNSETDWPQVQRDPQRTGHSPEVLGTSIKVAWRHRFYPERVFPQVQAIVYQDKVFVGTEMGRMYAVNAQTGEQEWEHDVGSPILSSVGVADDKVFFGAMDGAVYALDTGDGALIWKSELSWKLGFSTAPVVIEGRVMLGGRNGIFYALDPGTGAVMWQYDVGAPILQTAAWHDGLLFFGAMDMHVYAIESASGKLVWRSERIPGMALKDYWPVAHQGLLLVRAMVENEGLLVLDQVTGDQIAVVLELAGKVQHGATTPPVVDRDGYLVVPTPRLDGESGSCWGRFDVAMWDLVDQLEDGGCGNSDENENVSTAHNMIIGLHTIDTPGAAFSGYFDLDSRSWSELYSSTDHQPRYNTQGAGGNPPSISNGMIYHISLHYLTAWSAHQYEE